LRIAERAASRIERNLIVGICKAERAIPGEWRLLTRCVIFKRHWAWLQVPYARVQNRIGESGREPSFESNAIELA